MVPEAKGFLPALPPRRWKSKLSWYNYWSGEHFVEYHGEYLNIKYANLKNPNKSKLPPAAKVPQMQAAMLNSKVTSCALLNQSPIVISSRELSLEYSTSHLAVPGDLGDKSSKTCIVTQVKKLQSWQTGKWAPWRDVQRKGTTVTGIGQIWLWLTSTCRCYRAVSQKQLGAWDWQRH